MKFKKLINYKFSESKSRFAINSYWEYCKYAITEKTDKLSIRTGDWKK